MFTLVLAQFFGKYRGKYSKNKQKNQKSEFFTKKKRLLVLFHAETAGFLVILRSKRNNDNKDFNPSEVTL